MTELWEDFFNEVEGPEEPEEDQQQNIEAMYENPEVKTLIWLLDKFFPKAQIRPFPPHGPLVISRIVGQHIIGFIGVKKEYDIRYRWECIWQVAVGATQGRRQYRNLEGRPLQRVEGAIPWLTGVRKKIKGFCVESLRGAIHPDNFIPNPLLAFGAAYDLKLLGYEAEDVVDDFQIHLTWKEGRNGPQRQGAYIFRRVSPSEIIRIGIVGFGLKDTWRFGLAIEANKIDGLFSSNIDASSKPTLTEVPYDTHPAILKEIVDKFYVHQVLQWMLDVCEDEKLRTY